MDGVVVDVTKVQVIPLYLVVITCVCWYGGPDIGGCDDAAEYLWIFIEFWQLLVINQASNKISDVIVRDAPDPATGKESKGSKAVTSVVPRRVPRLTPY